ncbi:MAG: methyltransferase family protein [Promethearchaeota archaeon]
MEQMKKRALIWLTLPLISISGSIVLDKLLSFLSLGWYSILIGIFIIFLGMRLLKVSGRALKELGISTEEKRFGETDTLVTTGIYTCLRHPHHTGIALFVISIGFLLRSISFLVIFVPIFLTMTIYFVKKVEEKEAIEKFGDSYREYMKEVHALIPSLKCFKKKKNE